MSADTQRHSVIVGLLQCIIHVDQSLRLCDGQLHTFINQSQHLPAIVVVCLKFVRKCLYLSLFQINLILIL